MPGVNAHFGANAAQGLAVPQAAPVDVAEVDIGSLDLTSRVTMIFNALFAPGPGCTAVTITFGIHNLDGSGGLDFVASDVTVPAGQTYIPLTMMYTYQPTQAWPQASLRTALTQKNATGGGTVNVVGLAVLF